MPETNPEIDRAVKAVLHERAVRAGKARHSLDVYVESIVRRAPELTSEQRDRLALLLRGGSGDAA